MEFIFIQLWIYIYIYFTQFHLSQMFSHHQSAQDSAVFIQVLFQLIGKDSDDGKDWS